MKKLYSSILLALVCMSTACFGQTVVNQGFENGGSMPSGWAATIISGSYNWAICTTMPYQGLRAPHGGSYQVFFDCWNGTTGSQAMLVTPLIDYTGRASAATSVTAWFYRENGLCSGVNDYVQVYVNTAPNLTGSPTSMGIVPRWYTNAPSGGVTGSNGVAGWQQYTFTVPTTYNGATNYIIFRAQSAYGTCMGMDDVQYTTYPCTAPTGGSIAGNTPMCVSGSTITLTNPTGTAGGTWTSSNTSVATVGASSGVVTPGATPGTATITYSVTACSTSASATATVTVNAVAGAITGTADMCNGTGTTLSASPSGGTWSSSSTGVATVNSTSGAVSSVAPGTSTITYNLNNGCATSTKVVTVNTQPGSISGSSGTLCGGSGATSTTLSNATSGGVWSSNTTSVATIGSASGVVTGVSSGSATITYMMPGNCFVTRAVSVNAVAAITGPGSVCIGNTITLADATSGGTWSSSNPSVATINSSGVVTGIALGSTTITYSVSSLGCFATTVINATNPPSPYTVTGGGSYCSGGIGVNIGLNNSNPGISYVIYNGTTAAATVSGTGSALNFGLFTASGTYTVVANPGTTCAANMLGSATVSVNSLPTAFSVGGGGAYCSGGAGVNITLSSSTIGVNYQLILNGTTPVGSPAVGTSTTLTFGPVTAAGTYTIIATDATTGCVNNMTGSAIVTINSLPTTFAITGGGGFCLGGSGVNIGLAGSATGVSYQLLLSGAPVGTPVSGTGSAISFGLITTGGPYTIQATTTSNGCTNMMSGTATVTVNPLPTVYTVNLPSGSGAYCLGGAGQPVGLTGSQVGVNYQLFMGTTPMGSAVAGTGSAISFGNQTTVGSYTVVATNATTGCINSMFGSVAISTNPLPTVFTVTGGGSYCAGGAGVAVGLSGSTVGTSYQLFWNGTLAGAATGTGSAISFGLQLTAGTYTVVGTNSTGCVGNMSGSVVISINPLPNIYSVTGGGNYCAGGAGLPVNLSGSDAGINYQLYNGITATGVAVPGTGASLVFASQTAAGAYTVRATNATTTCTSNMTGSASIVVNPLPTVYATTGGGGYCAGSAGVHIGLATSNTGIDYQLMNSGGPVGAVVPGTGFALDFGFINTANIYYVLATNATTLCTVNMSGSVTVSVNPLPTAQTVTGGGNYCAGSGGLPVGLGSSVVGVYYQLYNGATPVGGAVAGTGSAISFGLQTAAGVYSVVGTNAVTGCSNNMSNTVTIVVNPLPGVFVITGGGNYCSGGTGVHVGLSGSAVGINYQLMNGVSTVGSPMSGTGGPLDFGLQTGSGSYTVVASDAGTGCANTMTGSVPVNINPLPALFNTTGGGDYCAGGSGLAIGLSSSSIGVSYQLLNSGLPSGAPMSGTGLALNFGVRTAAGNYTIVGTNITTGCMATMNGSATIVVNPLPVMHAVTGGGTFCLGTSGVSIGLANSSTGVDYQLYQGTTAVGTPIPGSSGSSLDFGLQTTVGIYTVKGIDASTGCVGNMSGSASVGTYPLPIVYNVTGGGSYCSDGTGVLVGLSGSNVGVSYQLWSGGFPMGSPVTGTGAAISFGLQTAAGSYTVVATNTMTLCEKTMNGAANVVINPLPTDHNITGGGNYCAGGTGVVIGLDGSDVGTLYQLMNGSTPMGAPKPGTGLAISFGAQTIAGSYTVVATNTSTTCVSTMDGSANVNIDPLPTAYTVTGGGNYCSGGSGVDISLSGSDPGFSYQLMRGTTAVGTPMTGISAVLSFGLQTVAGTYTVVATDLATGCTKTMTGSATVGINLLPTQYIVGGGGNYCADGTGLHVTLTGSNTGISYQLKVDGAPIGSPMAGTGMALDFGLQTTGGVYTVQATNNTTLCTNMMTGSVTIVVNPLPTIYPISSTSSTYCAGGGGVNIWTNSSDVGTNYQLYVGSTMIGAALPGTGSSVNFGYHFTAGTYQVVATNATTGCVSTMASSVHIVVNPLPTVYTITGGGGYCAGSTGANVGLSGSNTGISYQLVHGGTLMVGSPVMGTGSPISFGAQALPGVYTVVATNVATTCVNNMSGSATVVMNNLPAAFTVTGGGSYCAGGAGVNVMLTGSVSGINYQLYRNGTITVGSPVAGTGGVLNFGPQTAAGTYTVVATNPATGCNNNMTGSVAVNINPAPNAYSVVGGGNYCPGGTGVHIGLSNTDIGVTYQLMNGSSTVGLAVAGPGGTIDFGLQTATGSYTVMATDVSTGCAGTMSGSATVGINPLPTAYTVIGGGNYCAGGTGLHVGLSNSTTGVSYTLFVGTVSVATIPGTGSPIDFGLQTAAGTYTVLAINTSTTCQANMTGSVTIGINPVVTPSVDVTSSAGTTVCEGNFITFTASPTNGGSGPTYQWMVNGSPAAVGVSYSYVPSNGDVVSVMMTSSETCAMPSTVTDAVTMTVDPNQMPAVAITANPGANVCQGTTVTYDATPTYGGTPTYTWVVNGVNVGSSSSYSYIPANGDEVYVMMNSTYHCRLANSATSSKINMQVDVPVLPVVSITANPGLQVAAGQTATFTASVVNGGPTPGYQWMVNGVAVAGATTPVFMTSTLADNDSVTCMVQSSSACIGLQGFNSVRIHVTRTGVQNIGAVNSDIKLLPNPSKGIFTVKGTLGSSDEEVSIEVTNMLGQVIYNTTAQARNGVLNERIELMNVANGMYILNLRSGSEQKVFHVVIEQ